MLLNSMSDVRFYFSHEGGTTMTLVVSDTLRLPVWASVGVSRCHPKDQFVKAVGRRRALTSFLARNDVPRDVRRKVWAAYFERHSDLKPKQKGRPPCSSNSSK